MMPETNPLDTLDAVLAKLEDRYKPKKLSNGLALGRTANKTLLSRVGSVRARLAQVLEPELGTVNGLSIETWEDGSDAPVNLARDAVIVERLIEPESGAIARDELKDLRGLLEQLESLTCAARKPVGLFPVLTQLERWVDSLHSAGARPKLLIYSVNLIGN
ncbi:hypothetical protein H6F90_21935 [Trichocoleus sp. FACHB-591]|uniref:hypothetical protein n=1 Tax=Trichocoleus sp. FACHB-591 TaxID=2692872 RepID=UPI0016829A45|nr:hypothetical protein [Trichocoleus sp. FACHB-591]MBD2097737.1 hypothetical protein [Trichocoleus sp. FACHB-591]